MHQIGLLAHVDADEPANALQLYEWLIVGRADNGHESETTWLRASWR